MSHIYKLGTVYVHITYSTLLHDVSVLRLLQIYIYCSQSRCVHHTRCTSQMSRSSIDTTIFATTWMHTCVNVSYFVSKEILSLPCVTQYRHERSLYSWGSLECHLGKQNKNNTMFLLSYNDRRFVQNWTCECNKLPKKIIIDEERLPYLGYNIFRFCLSDINDSIRIAFSDVKWKQHNKLYVIYMTYLCHTRKRVVMCVALARWQFEFST